MRRRRLASMVGVATFVAATVVGTGVTTSASASGTAGAKPGASEIGVTADEIRIGVIADVENALSPGLFKGAVDAVQGFADYVNDNGGIAGRTMVVDFLDSHLSADDARNAIIRACQEDFAIIGTSALFLNNVDDLVACPDQTGAATGLPDIPGVATELVQACSPVSYPINPPTIDCATQDESPQTYRGNVGATRYYQQRFGKDLHGVTVNTNDLQSAHRSIQIGYELAKEAGIGIDAEFNVSARSPQSAYTPIVQAIADDEATIVMDQLNFASNISLRKEATLQGVDDVKVWSCPVSCYERGFLEQGGADVEAHFVPLTFLPFDETESNKMLASFVQHVGEDEVTGLGAAAWAGGVLLRDTLAGIVAEGGPNAVTRAELLEGLASTHDFDARGMWGTTDIGAKQPSVCGVMTQVQDGEFVRLRPKRPGTLRCEPRDLVTIELDLR